jgi:hypothetical protein
MEDHAMILKLVAPLRKALRTLEVEKRRIEQQIRVVQAALEALGGKGKLTPAPSATRPKPKQRRMSAATRRAVSQRMKAYWAKRKAEAAKGKGQGGK